MAQGDNNTRGRERPLAEVARLLRRSRGYLANAISEGMPASSTRGARGTPEWRVDVGKAAHWLEARAVRVAREELEAKHAQEVARLEKALEAAAGEAGEPISRSEALRRKAVAQARLAEIDVERAEGASMPTEEVQRVCVAVAATVRDRLLAVPHKCAPELAGDSTIHGCGAIVDREIHEALENLASMGERLKAGDFDEAAPPEADELEDEPAA